MAPMAKNKRKTPGAGLPAASAKRQKLGAAKPGLSKKRRSVNIDSLSWTPVDVPEMFNDAEGFYNLEMIEGVDVVKDGDKIEFRVADDRSDAPSAENDDDEFEGFSDPEPEAAPKAEAETPKLSKAEKKKARQVANLTAATDVTDASRESATAEATTTEPDAEPEKKEQEPAQTKGKQEPKAKTKKEKKEPKEKKEKKEKKGKKDKKDQEPADAAAQETNAFAGLDAADDGDGELDMSAWMALDLSPAIVSSIARLKFGKPTAIQAAAIPQVIAGHDVIGKASTGSGKTLAFGIPIVEQWLEKQTQESEKESDESSETKTPLALIISPTRELAHQIVQHLKALCEGLSTAPYICSVTGGLSVFKQQRQLAKADIIVGTPGRMWEVLSESTPLLEAFKGIQYLVVDEADRILSEGHFKEAEEILKALDRQVEEEDDEDEVKLAPRQTLVFSATFHKGLQQKLAGKGKFGLMSEGESMEYLLKRVNFREENPQFIDMNPVSQMAEGLKEGIIECGAMEKDLYLYALLLLNPNRRSLVFTNSISTARRLTPFLQNLNLNALPLHSQMPQKARLRSVERFTATKPGTASILIATDVAARGLDIKGIEQVVHYHVPRAADMYVHRSGRTARAETTGLSVLLCAPEEVTPVRRLAAKVHHEQAGRKKYLIRTVDLDRKLVNRLKPRVDLSKKISDAVLAKEKGSKDDDWMKKAAEELGVDYDSEELEKSSNWGGRGSQRKQKQQEARGLPKAEMGAMKAQLRELLSKRINAGVSERYLTTGKVDIDELLKGAKGDFLGRVDSLDLADW